jgi:hypothetical protein
MPGTARRAAVDPAAPASIPGGASPAALRWRGVPRGSVRRTQTADPTASASGLATPPGVSQECEPRNRPGTHAHSAHPWEGSGGARLFAGNEDISQSSAFPAHAITQQGNRAGRETLRKGCRAAAPSRPRGRCYRAVAASRSMVGPRVPLPSPRAGRGQRHLLLDHFVVAAAERRDALPRLRTTSAVAEATYLSRRLVARLSKG